eukprot:5975140-Pyramimonas_sp.AAC.1
MSRASGTSTPYRKAGLTIRSEASEGTGLPSTTLGPPQTAQHSRRASGDGGTVEFGRRPFRNLDLWVAKPACEGSPSQ